MSNNTKSLIEAKHLSFGYSEERELISELSFELSRGETLGIIGPNGGGKTTLLKLISGLLRPKVPYQGELKVFQKERKEWPLERKGFPPISYLPQQDTLPPYLPISVKDVLRLAEISQKTQATQQEVSPFTEEELIQHFEIGPYLKQDFRNLSGGQRQKVLLAKTFLLPSPLLLLDEPTKGLDGNGQDQFVALLNKAKERKDRGILIIDHHIHLVLKQCDKVLCLNRTYHWHDKTEDLDPAQVLHSLYHCEFEHQLLHESTQKGGDHE